MRCNDIETLSGVVPVPEKELRDFHKNIGILFSSGDDNEIDLKCIKSINDLLWTLFATVSVPTLSPTHQIAAIETLCGCIEQCIGSPRQSLVSLVLSLDVYEELYLIYTERLDGTWIKPLKQLLGTFVRLLLKSVAVSGDLALIDRTCQKLFEILCHPEGRAKAKAALLALTLFLSRSVLDFERFCWLYGRYQDGETSNPANVLARQKHLQGFLNHILSWVFFSDLAPAAGHLISILLSESTKSLGNSLTFQEGQDDILPIWILPTMHGLEKNLQGLQNFKSHAFPALFNSNTMDYWRFLLFLNIRGLSEMNSRPSKGDKVGDGEGFSANFKRAVLFAALQTGRATGLVYVTDNKSEATAWFSDKTVWIHVSIIAQLCGCLNADAQVAGLDLLILSPSSTQPLTVASLQCLKNHLPHIHAESDATMRSDINSLMQKLINRLRAVSSNIARKIAVFQEGQTLTHGLRKGISSKKQLTSTELCNTLKHHEQFICWFVKFLKTELYVNASYQRHISALKALLSIIMSGIDPSIAQHNLSKLAKMGTSWPFQMDIFDDLLYRLLLDLLLDPYEDIRQISLDLLKRSMPELVDKGLEIQRGKNETLRVRNALRRAESAMLASGRVDHADGVARFYGFIGIVNEKGYSRNHLAGFGGEIVSKNNILDYLTQSIEHSLGIAKLSMHDAVGKHSLHGLYTALRYVLEELVSSTRETRDTYALSSTLIRISESFSDTWQTVNHLICNDAPEGFVPDDLDEDHELTTKDALSYAWRALKESSLLLRSIVTFKLTKIVTDDLPDYVLTLEHFGNLCFTQLAELRHRGAFSTVAQTFAIVCQNCAMSQHDNIRDLIQVWYERTVVLIRQRGSAITRRSAGIPAIVTALLGADMDSVLFDQAITNLMELSEQAPDQRGSDGVTDLPQVHALNSLRAIFLSSRLGDRAEPFVGEVMRVAAESLNSKTWAIRNCGLMLFRSLIERLLGSEESQIDAINKPIERKARISYYSHPGLLELLSQFLHGAREGNDQSITTVLSTEAIFPVLDLLRRMPPSDEHRKIIGELVLEITSSKNWHIRNMAARTFAAFTPRDGIPRTVERLLANNNLRGNILHGRLFCVKYLVKELLKNTNLGQARKVLIIVCESWHSLLHNDVGAVHLATCIDIVNDFGFHALVVADNDCQSQDYTSLLTTFYDECLRQTMDVPSNFLQSHTLLNPLLNQAKVINAWITQLVLAVLQHRPRHTSKPYTYRHRALAELSEDVHVTEESLTRLCSRLSAASGMVQELLLKLLANTLSDTPLVEIRSIVERAFVEIFRRIPYALHPSKDKTINEALAKFSLSNDILIEQSPSRVESNISLWGAVLASRHHEVGHWTGNLINDMQQWIRCVRACLHEQNEFPLRHAATTSLHAFSVSSTAVIDLPETLHIALLFALYDTLCDDDDDIRILGASAVSNILRRSATGQTDMLGITPPLASQMLCVRLLRGFESSSVVLTESLCRLLGQAMDKRLTLIPAEEILQSALIKEKVLFNEEKSNLYVDPVKEADTWSRVLKHLTLDDCPQSLLDSFSVWVIEGLQSLTSFAQSEVDGALGGTSKPDVFALGMRVLCGADVLLNWRMKSRKINVRGSTLRKNMAELAVAGERNDLHGMWLEKIDKVLSASVEKRLGRVWELLASLPVSSC